MVNSAALARAKKANAASDESASARSDESEASNDPVGLAVRKARDVMQSGVDGIVQGMGGAIQGVGDTAQGLARSLTRTLSAGTASLTGQSSDQSLGSASQPSADSSDSLSTTLSSDAGEISARDRGFSFAATFSKLGWERPAAPKAHKRPRGPSVAFASTQPAGGSHAHPHMLANDDDYKRGSLDVRLPGERSYKRGCASPGTCLGWQQRVRPIAARVRCTPATAFVAAPPSPRPHHRRASPRPQSRSPRPPNRARCAPHAIGDGRYCVFSRVDGRLKIYSAADAALTGESTIAELTLASACRKRADAARGVLGTLWGGRGVAVGAAGAAGNAVSGGCELSLRTSSGDLVEVRSLQAAEASQWLEALGVVETFVTSGWLTVQRKGKWKRRFAVYHTRRSELAIFRSRADSLQGDGDACRGHGLVAHAVPRPSPERPFGFACYAPDGMVWELSAEGTTDLRNWLSVRATPPYAAVCSSLHTQRHILSLGMETFTKCCPHPQFLLHGYPESIVMAG